MKAKEALAQRLELGRDQPLWRENSCWAGLLIAVGNEFAASNAAPLAEKRRRVRGICQLPEMASACSTAVLWVAPNWNIWLV